MCVFPLSLSFLQFGHAGVRSEDGRRPRSSPFLRAELHDVAGLSAEDLRRVAPWRCGAITAQSRHLTRCLLKWRGLLALARYEQDQLLELSDLRRDQLDELLNLLELLLQLLQLLRQHLQQLQHLLLWL